MKHHPPLKRSDIEREVAALSLKLRELLSKDKDADWVFCLRVCDDGSGRYVMSQGMQAYDNYNPFSDDEDANEFHLNSEANNAFTWSYRQYN